jgi:predicted GTPase
MMYDMRQIEQMLETFSQIVVGHPRLKEGLNRLTGLLQFVGDARLIIILGGTGNGKSTLVSVAIVSNHAKLTPVIM